VDVENGLVFNMDRFLGGRGMAYMAMPDRSA
jgi:hypothetical protein